MLRCMTQIGDDFIKEYRIKDCKKGFFILFYLSLGISLLKFGGRNLNFALLSDFFFVMGILFLVYGLFGTVLWLGFFENSIKGMRKLRFILFGSSRLVVNHDDDYEQNTNQKLANHIVFTCLGIGFLFFSSISLVFI